MQPSSSGFKAANGINLYYEVYGTGEPLVLIHGGGSSIRFDWGELISRLSGKYQLIGIDLQNHGRSGHRDIPQTFEQDARDIIAVLDQLDIRRAIFMGFSNGGTTVMLLAHLFPHRVTKLIVASAICKRSGMPDGFFEGMQHATIDHMPQVFKDNFLKLNPDPDKLQNMFEKDSQRMIRFQDWDDSLLKNIQCPVLFLGGDRDLQAEHFVWMWRQVPGARLMILPATHGAYIMADENGYADTVLIDCTTALIERFLS